MFPSKTPPKRGGVCVVIINKQLPTCGELFAKIESVLFPRQKWE